MLRLHSGHAPSSAIAHHVVCCFFALITHQPVLSHLLRVVYASFSETSDGLSKSFFPTVPQTQICVCASFSCILPVRNARECYGRLQFRDRCALCFLLIYTYTHFRALYLFFMISYLSGPNVFPLAYMASLWCWQASCAESCQQGGGSTRPYFLCFFVL